MITLGIYNSHLRTAYKVPFIYLICLILTISMKIRTMITPVFHVNTLLTYSWWEYKLALHLSRVMDVTMKTGSTNTIGAGNCTCEYVYLQVHFTGPRPGDARLTKTLGTVKTCKQIFLSTAVATLQCACKMKYLGLVERISRFICAVSLSKMHQGERMSIIKQNNYLSEGGVCTPPFWLRALDLPRSSLTCKME